MAPALGNRAGFEEITANLTDGMVWARTVAPRRSQLRSGVDSALMSARLFHNVVPETLGDDPAGRVMSVDVANADRFGPRLDTVLPTMGISRPRSPAEIESRSTCCRAH